MAMLVTDAGRAVLKKELKPGELFAYKVGSAVALGLFLATNDFDCAAVALTHAPGRQAIIPSLVSNHFLDNDTAVFVFEDSSISVDQSFGTLKSEEPSVGAVLTSTAGTFLRCSRDDQEFDVNLRTGEISYSLYLPRFWTMDWIIEDRNERVLYDPNSKILS